MILRPLETGRQLIGVLQSTLDPIGSGAGPRMTGGPVSQSNELVIRSTGRGGVRTPTSTFDETLSHKTILVGDSGVGKTSLLVQFDQGKFQTGSFAATVGIGFTNKVVEIEGTKVKLQIWDTAGQERFRSITHAYYRDAHALLLLYDVSSKASFDNIRAWLAEIYEYAHDDVVIMLLGNKADITSERVVRSDEGERFAKEYDVAFMETSAKTGLNVDLAFTAIARKLRSLKTNGLPSGGASFNVAEYVDRERQRSGCCG